MRALNLTLVAVLVTTVHAEPKDEYAAIRSKLVVLDDGKHHYFAYAPASDLMHSKWFYGDDKVLHPQVFNGNRPDVNKKRATWGIVDPRFQRDGAELLTDFDTGEFVVRCGKHKTTLHPLAAEAAAKLTAKVAIEPYRDGRLTTFLGREPTGTTYYFVDRPEMPSNDPESQDYRVYVGKRGALKQLPIKDQAIDNSGAVLITAAGTLHFTHATGVLEWIPVNGKPLALTVIDGDLDLVYNKLGVYAGRRLGTPCDDL